MKQKQQERARLELKHKVMIERIDKLYDKYSLLSVVSTNGDGPVLVDSLKKFPKHSKTLSIIKEQYNRMYDAIMQTGEVEKYQEIEDTIISKLAKIELELDKKAYSSSKEYQDVITGIIENIKKSKNYQEFRNVEDLLKHISTLKELLQIYSLYIAQEDIEKATEQIIALKFEILYRKQIEELIYRNGGEFSYLTQSKGFKERQIFIKLLKEKMNQLCKKKEADEVLNIEPEMVLSNSNLLERLIIIDMKANSDEYINLTKSPIFNAHICNIANDPFYSERYFEEQKRKKEIPSWIYGLPTAMRHGATEMYGYIRKGQTSKPVNYILLRALLKDVITDENVSIIDCENLYERFGFKCNPIALDIGQKCVKMIWEKERLTDRYKNIVSDNKENKGKSIGIGNIEIVLDCLDYKFENSETKEDIFESALSDRRVGSKAQNKRDIKEKRKKIEENGVATTDSEILFLISTDLLNAAKTEQHRHSAYSINKYVGKLKRYKCRLTKQESEELLRSIRVAYRVLNIDVSQRCLCPLENMPDDYIDVEFYNIERLWDKYCKDGKKLGIKLQKIGHRGELYGGAKIKIFLNLEDIAGLPLDYEKVMDKKISSSLLGHYKTRGDKER